MRIVLVICFDTIVCMGNLRWKNTFTWELFLSAYPLTGCCRLYISIHCCPMLCTTQQSNLPKNAMLKIRLFITKITCTILYLSSLICSYYYPRSTYHSSTTPPRSTSHKAPRHRPPSHHWTSQLGMIGFSYFSVSTFSWHALTPCVLIGMSYTHNCSSVPLFSWSSYHDILLWVLYMSLAQLPHNVLVFIPLCASDAKCALHKDHNSEHTPQVLCSIYT